MTPHPDPNASQTTGRSRLVYQLRASGIKSASPNPLRSGIHSRGYLPHLKREGAAYFVTFRLADSLPREALLKLQRARAERLRQFSSDGKNGAPDVVGAVNRDFRRELEKYLDAGAGRCHLKIPEIAGVVANALLFFQGERYRLEEWVIMPNHVHAVVWPAPNFVLSEILKSWKQFTARTALSLLHLETRRFWQPESYDHWIRNDDEKARVRRYIRNNPVAAGLCAQPEEWRWSSANGRAGSF